MIAEQTTPFAVAAPLYRAKFWAGTMPLPPREKHPPPTGYTGHAAPYPTPAMVETWRDQRGDGNICLRLAGVDSAHEVIALDVDHYIKGGKQKCGGDQLAELIEALGPLPDTWVSTSRVDGHSGKRFYRVPRGLHFKGQVAKDIECIQKGHRYAAVWPSWNPDSRDIERWFPPGAPLTIAGQSVWDGEIPDARELPLLPDAWLDYLTNGRTHISATSLDSGASVSDLDAWTQKIFNEPNGDPCDEMRRAVDRHKRNITTEATSYDKIRNAHWHLIELAAEGHTGYNTALRDVNDCYRREMKERDKRGPDELRREMFRSRTRALRKIKRDVEAAQSIGAQYPPRHCLCHPSFSADPNPTTFAKFLKDLTRVLSPSKQQNAATANRPELYDAKISEYIAQRYLTDFCHSGALGWMQWTGKRWNSVGEPVVIEVTRQAVLAFHREETNLAQRRIITADRLAATAKLLSANRISAMVRLAKGVLSVPDDRWDANPDLLNCANGVVDLRTGALGDHDRALMCTKLCPTEYHGSATHPDWTAALGAVPAGAQDWLRDRLGQGITGHMTPDDVLTLLKGGGENGKSTVVGGILKSVGHDYAITLPDRVLLARPSDHPTELMTLRGARLAFMEELPELGHLNVKRLKFVCGTPRLTARLCGQDSMEWDATHSVFVTTNHWPRVDESDHGTWRRLRALKFPFRFRKPGENIETAHDRSGDTGLRQRILSGHDKQHEAILAWLIAGAQSWYARKRAAPIDPQTIAADTHEWRASADHILRFMTEKLVPDPSCYMMGTDLYAMFEQWMKDQGHVVWSDQTFAARFEGHADVQSAGIAKKVTRATARGLTLKRPQLTDSEVPQQFNGWVGIRPRDRSDDFDPETALTHAKASDQQQQ